MLNVINIFMFIWLVIIYSLPLHIVKKITCV
nr:MAG TPA: hypothetical protein [Ackermannviridae sp.]